MRIGVDVMGGDNAPDEILKGCVLTHDGAIVHERFKGE